MESSPQCSNEGANNTDLLQVSEGQAPLTVIAYNELAQSGAHSSENRSTEHCETTNQHDQFPATYHPK